MSVMRALVVDDDAAYRRILDQSLRRIGVAEVGVAGELAVARGKIEREAIDVVTIDVVLRGESGLELLQWLRAHHPKVIAILVTSGSASQACSAVDGLLLGAAGLIIKPTGPDAAARLDAALSQIIAMPGKRAMTTGRIPRLPSQPMPPIAPQDLVAVPRELIALGASTGGPPAVLLFLQSLPRGYATPIVITQHMPAPHVPHFATLLRERTGLAVEVAQHGESVAACGAASPGSSRARSHTCCT